MSRTTPVAAVHAPVSDDALTEYDRNPTPNVNDPVPFVIADVIAAQLIAAAAVCDSDDAPASCRTLSTIQRIILPSRNANSCGSITSTSAPDCVPFQSAPSVTSGTVRSSRSPTGSVPVRP